MIRQSIIERLTREKSEPTEYTLEFLSTADLYCSLLDFVTNVFPETVKIDQRGALCGDIQISCRGLAFFLSLGYLSGSYIRENRCDSYSR